MNDTTELLSRPIGRLVAERPARAGIFESLGIDYCCGGRRRLDDACRAAGADPAAVAARLASEPSESADAGSKVELLPLPALCDHIEAAHHAWLRRELPHLSERMSKVVERHGGRDPRLVELYHVLAAFRAELEDHMMKEERVLFPAIRRMAGGDAESDRSVAAPIAVMEAEHDAAGAALVRMRQLTNGFNPPASACLTHRALLAGLAELEADMHRHVHLENNVLFPRALGTGV
jgi:regulator of cell morphogenesis and NO signaling